MPEPVETARASLQLERGDAGVVLVQLAGEWLKGCNRPDSAAAIAELATQPLPASIEFDTRSLGQWDSTLMTFVTAVRRSADEANIPVDPAGLPEGAQKLLQLAFAVPERAGARKTTAHDPLLVRVGKATQDLLAASKELVTFLGELALSFGRLFRGKAILTAPTY